MKVINAVTAKELLAQDTVAILDIRDHNSYEQSHINQAIHFDLDRMKEICDSLNKQQPVLVYCYHGVSSLQIAQALENLEFKEVYSLEGGYAGWS